MNPTFCTKFSEALHNKTLLSAWSSLYLVGCVGIQVPTNQPPLGSNSQVSSITHNIAADMGRNLNQKDQAELDTYLAKAMEMKKEVETNATALKRHSLTDQTVALQAQQKYDSAIVCLNRLNQSVQTDFRVYQGKTSLATEEASKAFEAAGNEVRFYYAQVSGEGRFGTSLLVVLDAINELYSIWASYSQAQKEAYVQAVDQRLSPTPWASL